MTKICVRRLEYRLVEYHFPVDCVAAVTPQRARPPWSLQGSVRVELQANRLCHNRRYQRQRGGRLVLPVQPIQRYVARLVVPGEHRFAFLVRRRRLPVHTGVRRGAVRKLRGQHRYPTPPRTMHRTYENVQHLYLLVTGNTISVNLEI